MAVEDSDLKQGRQRPALATVGLTRGSRLVGEEAGSRAGVEVEAQWIDDGDGRRKPILDRKTKKYTDQDDRRKREKPGSRDREKDSLGQPVHRTGGRTLGTGGAAPGAGDHGSAPGAARAEATVTARVYDRLG